MQSIIQKSAATLLTFSFTVLGVPLPIIAAVESGNEYFDMDIAQLMQITITSVAKKPQNLSDAAAAVFVITADDIHRSGVTSIPESLRMVPGLQVDRIDANKWAITSRGFSGNFANKLLVMMDGRTVYSPAFSGVYWDVQDTLLEDIDRIEVIRGPGATIWGANAVNGVINIITKKAGDTQGGLVTLGGGSEDQFMGGLRYGTRIGESAHGRVYLTYHKQDSLELHGNGEDAGDNWNSLRTGFRMDGEHGERNSWTLQGDLYANNEHQIVFPLWLTEYPYRTQRHDDFDASGGNILGRWQKKLSPVSSWTMQAYYDYTNRDELIMEQAHHTLDLDLQYQDRIGKRHNLVMGLGYRFVDASFDNTSQVSVHPENRSENLYSGFIQDEIMLFSDRLWLTLGAKWEHNDFTGHEIQPSGRLLFKATQGQTLWAAVSRAVRTPSEFEEGGSIIAAVNPTVPPYPMLFTLNGDGNFDSEELIAYEAGYRWLLNSEFSLDISLFYNDYDDLLTAEPGSPQSFNILYFTNKLYGSTHGLELSVDWKPVDRLKFQLGYTYIGFDLKVDADSINSNLDTVVEETSPEHQISLQSSISISRTLQLNLWGRYVGRLRSTKNILSAGDLSVDEYLELDVNMSWRPIENLEVMLVGQNLLNSSHLEYVSEFSTPATEVERSFYGKLTFRF